ncbi:MAG: Rieske (2Fe-2S) protein [Melioribacteraceae bacterium]|nr:Rieske (2Fe-2S) protein [Melioribacteraceae bacterium]
MNRPNKNKIEKEQNPQSRRSFLNKIWIGIGAIASIEVLGISINFLFHSSKKEKKDLSSFVVAGLVEDFKPNSVTSFRSGKFYLSRLQDGGFIAMSLKCTHLGCSVGWNESKNKFICPCHSSSFEINGNVISPPAPSALELLPIIIENGIVKVNSQKPMKRKRFSNSQATYVES